MAKSEKKITMASNETLIAVPMGEPLGPVITYRTLKLTAEEATTLNAAWIGLMEHGHMVRGQEVKHPVDVFYYLLEQLKKAN